MKFKFLKKFLRRFYWIYNDIRWLFHKQSVFDSSSNSLGEITIGITTFMDRFEFCFMPLLSKLETLFPYNEIIVVANGHYRREEQLKYILLIREYCKKYDNVKLIYFNEPKGLSFLWNTIIRQSRSSTIFLLNDDLRISIGFKKFIKELNFRKMSVTTINNSWSHFLITKILVDKVGYFDENFLEIGGEDDDYAARLAIAGIKLDNYNTNTVGSVRRKRHIGGSINSYGKDKSVQRGGYSTLNTEYLESKWIMSDSYFEGSTYVPNRKYKYWKPREGALN